MTPPPASARLRPTDDVAVLRAEFDAYRHATDARLEALGARVQALEQAELQPGDVDALTAMLPVLVGLKGSDCWFTVGEVRAADTVAVRIAFDGWSSQRIGKLFARAAGLTVAGFRLERASKAHGARLWKIVAVLERGV